MAHTFKMAKKRKVQKIFKIQRPYVSESFGKNTIRQGKLAMVAMGGRRAYVGEQARPARAARGREKGGAGSQWAHVGHTRPG